MLFQTPEFMIFMLAVLISVALVRTHTLQILLLLVASYVFYMSWDPIFILLIVFSTANDYVCGRGIASAKSQGGRRMWLLLSCVSNLGLLAVFKYFRFFVESTNHLLEAAGFSVSLPVLEVTLPVGISFYTFQTMSYTIDVFRGSAKAEKSFLRFALYVAFFPQLVAGPILRSTDFLPQLQQTVRLRESLLRSGFHLFLVGLVKKVVIADQLAPFVDFIFRDPHGLPSVGIMLGALAFGVQIYCDFSGYTDMARGVGRMLGFSIPINFNYPYVAASITDFWRRWHISLSSWLRDYLYIPLGGNRGGALSTYRNLLVTMGLGGLWHGAGWNFVVWGFYQGGLLAVERLFGIAARVKKDKDESSGLGRRALLVARWAFVQYLVFLGWLIFRARSADDVMYCVRKYVLFDGDLRLSNLGLGNTNPFVVAGIMFLFVVMHATSFRLGGLANRLDDMGHVRRWFVYSLVVLAVITLWPSQNTAFIYFQF